MSEDEVARLAEALWQDDARTPSGRNKKHHLADLNDQAQSEYLDKARRIRAAISGVPEGAASATIEQLRAAVSFHEDDGHSVIGCVVCEYRAALRSVPSPEPLDVERLARALHAMPHHYRGGADNDLARMACQQTSPSACEHKAASIAREYARLAASQPVPEDET